MVLARRESGCKSPIKAAACVLLCPALILTARILQKSINNNTGCEMPTASSRTVLQQTTQTFPGSHCCCQPLLVCIYHGHAPCPTTIKTEINRRWSRPAGLCVCCNSTRPATHVGPRLPRRMRGAAASTPFPATAAIQPSANTHTQA